MKKKSIFLLIALLSMASLATVAFTGCDFSDDFPTDTSTVGGSNDNLSENGNSFINDTNKNDPPVGGLQNGGIFPAH